MTVFEIYFKTDLSFSRVASWVDERLNPSIFEKRDGANRGGVYYLIKTKHLTFELMENKGEVAIPERGDFSYYMISYSEDPSVNSKDLEASVLYVSQMLARSDISTDVDSLS